MNVRTYLAVLIGLILAGPALAGDRVDFFTPDGKRTGYAVVDRQMGRVDFYDANSRRTGWGRVTSTGKVERFGLDGRRQEETALPLDLRPPGR